MTLEGWPDSEITAEDIVKLSTDKFRWKTDRDVDRVANLFDDDLIFVHLNGRVSSKSEWIEEMRSGRFVYERISPRELTARVYGDAAALFGKARFDVRFSGHRASFDLAFTEVYARKSGAWRLVNLHTCSY
ncbi:nuclear transport factor 2 family protein [Asticcacaulis excentricus]|uniref:nuclear transport factor 2 family protein n=1 Tax=Asticcacaulis excentricus TaxID=78587 RepID=UPI000F822FA9|nr:nuclear transport factor 2 family protein [Asticcacaulis excentricus]